MRDGGTPWDVRWQGPPFPSDRVSFDPHARVKDLDQSIQLHEGEQSLRHVIEALGEDTLMFATDYPHSESWFPKSVDAVLKWTSISERARRKLLWENAARCYRRFT